MHRQSKALGTVGPVVSAMLIWLIVSYSTAAQAQAIPECSSDLSIGESCIDERGRQCVWDGLGAACFGTGGGGISQCSIATPVGATCQNSDGQLCTVQGNGGLDCRDITIGGNLNCLLEGGLGPDAIVPQCEGGTLPAPLLVDLTEAAIDDVLDFHLLPEGDADAVIRYARDSVRANLLTRLSNLFLHDNYTAEEQAVVDFYTDRLYELRVRQAEVAEQEFNKWQNDPCGYRPPEGFSITWQTTTCNTPLGNLFGLDGAPRIDELQAYGIGEVLREDIVNDLEALAIASGTQKYLILTFSSIAAGLVFAGTAALLFFTSVGPLVVSVTAPYALVAFSTGATGLLGGLIGAAGAVGIALLAIVGSILAVITYVEYEEFVAEAEMLVENTEVPILRDEIETERGASEFFQVFIKSTQPEYVFNGVPTVPTATVAQFFRLYDESGNPLEPTSTISLSVDGLDDSGALTAIETGLAGGWFSPVYTYTDQDGNAQQTATYTLDINYLDWNGQPRRAARRGSRFVIPQVAADGTLEKDANGEDVPALETDELKFIAADGGKLVAKIVSDISPPVITPSVVGTKLNGGEWFVSDVIVNWDVQDDESSVDILSGCEPITIAVDGASIYSCIASSAGGQESASVTVLRDATPPSISASATPPANANGWNNSDVVVEFTCSDATSGIAQCTGDVTLLDEGASQAVAGTATDIAGNVASITPLQISIDRSSPDIGIYSPIDGATYLVNEVIVADWSVTDSLSGLADTDATTEDGSPIDTASIGAKTFTVSATDNADNATTAEVSYAVISPAQAVAVLVSEIERDITAKGTKTALAATLNSAARLLDADKVRPAINKLQAFVAKVNALNGQQIDAAYAAAYLASAERILGTLR